MHKAEPKPVGIYNAEPSLSSVKSLLSWQHGRFHFRLRSQVRFSTFHLQHRFHYVVFSRKILTNLKLFFQNYLAEDILLEAENQDFKASLSQSQPIRLIHLVPCHFPSPCHFLSGGEAVLAVTAVQSDYCGLAGLNSALL